MSGNFIFPGMKLELHFSHLKNRSFYRVALTLAEVLIYFAQIELAAPRSSFSAMVGYHFFNCRRVPTRYSSLTCDTSDAGRSTDTPVSDLKFIISSRSKHKY